MIAKFLLNATVAAGFVFGFTLAQAQAGAAPADGITMDMMPITQEQLTACRSQASGQLTDEQKTLHDREHGQDKDKMAQGAITGASGAVSSALSVGGAGGATETITAQVLLTALRHLNAPTATARLSPAPRT